MKEIFLKIRIWLQGLSFKTGIIVLSLCLFFYAVSFLQALLPLSLAWKGALWVVFFGLAKTCQYSGILIIGKEGWRRLKARYFSRKKEEISN